MLTGIKPFIEKPALFQPGTAELWTDDHISKGMLEAHLHPAQDAATRNHEFVERSVEWFTKLVPPPRFPRLLDLGCGPGIYAEKFSGAGYEVTGVDISRRSIEYATRQAHGKNLPITYHQASYLDMDWTDQFSVATLIYCDFGVLSQDNRKTLLSRVFTALESGGRFVFDGFTPRKYDGMKETRNWKYSESGFFTPAPHVSLESFYRYDEDHTFLNQYVIVTDGTVECFNVWEHTFTLYEIERDLKEAGFCHISFFDDIAGAPYTGTGQTICAVAGKE